MEEGLLPISLLTLAPYRSKAIGPLPFLQNMLSDLEEGAEYLLQQCAAFI